MIRKIILKKEKGMAGVFDFFPALILVFVGACVLIYCGMQAKYLNTVNELENLSRKYALIMETTNGLTTEDLAHFYEELEAIGIPSSDVDFTGTTFWDENVEYGEEIYLNVRARIPCGSLRILYNLTKQEETYKKEVNIRKCAIALS